MRKNAKPGVTKLERDGEVEKAELLSAAEDGGQETQQQVNEDQPELRSSVDDDDHALVRTRHRDPGCCHRCRCSRCCGSVAAGVPAAVRSDGDVAEALQEGDVLQDGRGFTHVLRDAAEERFLPRASSH